MVSLTMRFQHKKSLGQHFLKNEHVPKLMADAGDVKAGDVVLEIGPGTGMLTRELLKRDAVVYAVEADERALAVLTETFPKEIRAGTLTLFHADMRTAPLSQFGLTEHAYKIVANIPYYLSGKLFRTVLETNLQPSALVFLVQKEVAERIARNTKESLLSLSVKAYGTPRYIQTISRGNFTPPPRVDSAIIAVSDISHKHFKNLNEAFFFEMLHLGFGAKRKQLLGNLAQHIDRDLLINIFSTCTIPKDTRAEDLSLEEWLTLVYQLAHHR